MRIPFAILTISQGQTCWNNQQVQHGRHKLNVTRRKGRKSPGLKIETSQSVAHDLAALESDMIQVNRVYLRVGVTAGVRGATFDLGCACCWRG